MEMQPLYYLFFLAFVIIAYMYYTRKNRQRTAFFEAARKKYIEAKRELDSDKKESLEKGYPWEGMSTELLLQLFGEPYRKRPMNNDASETIWTYGRLFVLVENGRVVTWHDR